MPKYTVNITPTEEKALETDMVSIQEWLDNAIHNKARQCIDMVCQRALNDLTHTILTRQEKMEIADLLTEADIIVNTVKGLPTSIKDFIVQNARVKSAAQLWSELYPIP